MYESTKIQFRPNSEEIMEILSDLKDWKINRSIKKLEKLQRRHAALERLERMLRNSKEYSVNKGKVNYMLHESADTIKSMKKGINPILRKATETKAPKKAEKAVLIADPT
jgi:protein subunit release factor A